MVLIGALLLGITMNGYAGYASEPTKMGTLTSASASITTEYSKYHKGVDLAFEPGAKIASPFNGHVETLEAYDDMCFVIITDNVDGKSIVFINLHNSPLNEGETVKRGDVIGTTGQEALHISYYPKGVKNEAVDPSEFLQRAGLVIKKGGTQ